MYHYSETLAVRINTEMLASATYISHLLNTSLDLLIDEQTGVWNILNSQMIFKESSIQVQELVA